MKNILIIDSQGGDIHAPQTFAHSFGYLLGPKERMVLQHGPVHPDYWNVWHSFIYSGNYVYMHGLKGTIIEDLGDIFFCPVH